MRQGATEPSMQIEPERHCKPHMKALKALAIMIKVGRQRIQNKSLKGPTFTTRNQYLVTQLSQASTVKFLQQMSDLE